MAASFFWTAHSFVMYNGSADGKGEAHMKKHFKILLPILALVLLAAFVFRPSPTPEVHQEPTGVQAIVQELVNAYSRSDDAETAARLSQLEDIDGAAAEKWQRILTCWEHSGNDMELHLERLPEGLDTGDGLCLIVLGYQLNPDGSMRDELIGRLETALLAAEEYPQCRILCTGGGTASRNEAVTEADAMAQWLTEQGIPESRLIVENQSLTTAQNAVFSYRILREDYPEIRQLALITSDYHIPWAQVLFQAQLILTDSPIRLTSHAAYPTGQQLTDAALRRYQTSALLELNKLNAETLAA